MLAALLFVACGGSSTPSGRVGANYDACDGYDGTLRDASAPVAGRLRQQLNTMARVGDHLHRQPQRPFSTPRSRSPPLSERRRVPGRHRPSQLLPTEAMVKRHKGYSPATDDWEFFSAVDFPDGHGHQELGRAREELPRRRLRASCHARPPASAFRLRVRKESRMCAAPADGPHLHREHPTQRSAARKVEKPSVKNRLRAAALHHGLAGDDRPGLRSAPGPSITVRAHVQSALPAGVRGISGATYNCRGEPCNRRGGR